MSSMLKVSAGKRGHMWECKPCGFKGEKLASSNHIYLKHLTYEEYPFFCTLCNFSFVQKAKFLKHPKWYLEQKMLAGEKAESAEVDFMAVQDKSTILGEMMRSLTVEESTHHWESRKRSVKPLVMPSAASSPVVSLGFPSPAGPCSPPVASLGSAGIDASMPVTDSSLPERLTDEDQKLLDEFLISEPSGKSSVQTNTDHLVKEIERQNRVISAISILIENLQKQIQSCPPISFRQHGPGEGERYNPVLKRSSPKKKAPKRLQSVVKVVRKILPKPSRTPHRSPLDDLFRSDVPSFHHHQQRPQLRK